MEQFTYPVWLNKTNGESWEYMRIEQQVNVNVVLLPKNEIIDILRTLEGLKRKLQPLLNRTA